MPSRGSGHGVPPRKGTRRRLFLPGNPSRGSSGRSRPGKAPEQDCYYLEMPSIGSGQGVPPGTALEQDRSYQEMPSKARVSPRKGSRTRSLLPGSAFKRLWSEGPRSEGVPWNPGESQNEGLEVQAKRKSARGNPPGALRVPWSFSPLFWLFLGLPGTSDLLLRKREQVNIGGSP